ncbi:S-adenosyl-L-methionine-dependent methyltransferase [Globomyces pollinis-pini]|nr:S-adenosyl-L-methionine-dependent methyltransferase [Globomyces pollinis-pini]
MTDYSKHHVAPAPYPVEGIGFSSFSNTKLYLAMATVPLATLFIFDLAWSSYLFLAAGLAIPVFCAFNIISSFYNAPERPQKSLPGLPVEDYLTIKTDALKSYKGRNKIPIATFFEAYFDEQIDLKGDMLETLEARYDWASFTFTLGQAAFFITQWVPETLWHSRKQDEDQVRNHYDRGDDFYNWFLGPMMIYTSGIIGQTNKRESLEEMQERKLETVCRKINVQPGDKMLDIGCGWGTLSVHAAKKGATVTGVTLGRNQTEWGMGKAREAGVEKNVNILCTDYRDIPKTKYNKITCLEMAEHVGILRFQTFLHQVREMLEDDGIFFLQIAGLRRAWQYEDLQWGLFMAKYVFPGADASPPLNWVMEQLERAGFEIESCETLGVHYSTTIFRWYENWMKNKEKVIENYGVRWFRIWEFFLAYSTIIARQGSATVYQIVAHKNLNAFDRTQFIDRRTR